MARPRQYADNAARQLAYRQRKRNAPGAPYADNGVTFDDILRAVPVVTPSGSDDCYTPRWLIDTARRVLGRIDLDVASSAEAQAVIQAARYYTVADNALLFPWAGRVWCNPPYSDPLPWVQKLLAHYRAGEVLSALLLLNIAGSPAWARLLWEGGYPVCILSGRIDFWRPNGLTRASSNKYDQFIWYLGRHKTRFAATFAQYGVIR